MHAMPAQYWKWRMQGGAGRPLRVCGKLSSHFRGEIRANPTILQSYVAQFDWSNISNQYDTALTQLALVR
jgi:hypothetical protein